MTTLDDSHEKGIFLSWKHDVSRRTAILEEADGMAWLYLTAPDAMKPERDCPLFTTAPPVEEVDWKAAAASGLPPPISKEVASDEAMIEHPRSAQFDALWSADGHSVAVTRLGRMIGMIVASAKRGHSRALATDCPLGHPFDEAVAAKVFGDP